MFLITVSWLTQNQWYLMAVGSIGLLQTVIAAGTRHSNAAHRINAREVETFENAKVVDLEDSYPKCGNALLSGYFPGGELGKEEENWWKGRDRTAYESLRRHG